MTLAGQNSTVKYFLPLGLLGLWTVVAGMLAGVTAFYAGLSLAAVVFWGARPWNFPGDPPVFDLLIIPAAVSAGCAVPLWLILRSANRSTLQRFAYASCRVSLVVSLAVLLGCTAGVLERQDARWAAVRNGIRQYGNEIAAAAGDRNRVLTSEEFERFHEQFMPKPVSILLWGYGTVRLRMAHGVYPYVGVDFGDGGHALFDPRTMWCTYSD